MSAPPTFNLIGEVLAIAGLVNITLRSSFQLGLLVFFRGAYTLVLYAASQHGQIKFSAGEYNIIKPKDNQVFFILTFPIFAIVVSIAFIMI